MAKVKVEDKWQADPRAIYLRDRLGEAATGLMVHAWLKVAWSAEHRGTVLIPLEEFKMLGANWALIFEAQLAVLVREDDQDYVYLRGSKDLYKCAGKKPAESRHYAVTPPPFRHQPAEPCHQGET